MSLPKKEPLIQYTFYYLFIISLSCLSCQPTEETSKIDRYALVNRHNIAHSKIDSISSLTVGNGEFAFTAGITGLQSFPDIYENGIPLGTQSQWGWHTFPNPNDYTLEDVMTKYKVGNDSIPYAYQYTDDPNDRKVKATNWLRENPHRLHLGLIGLEMIRKDSTIYAVDDIQNPQQNLDLWKGALKSSFELDGNPVKVVTYCHQDEDMVAFRITSPLLTSSQISISLKFPYATHEKFSSGYDLNKPEKHSTTIIEDYENGVVFKRQLDDSIYYARVEWQGNAKLKEIQPHDYRIIPASDDQVIEVSCHFSSQKTEGPLPGFVETAANNVERWAQFWQSGGAIDFSECTDPRADELERRVVLSQYLTKIQCTGSLPPQETGLTYNSWHGKFHLEMHWWHAMHFIWWNRPDQINQQFDYYFDIYDKAKATAELQGYKGVRWPKMVGPEGRESPSSIGAFLIWQQPHIIYFAEMLYQSQEEDPEILKKYEKLVFATADFMASYARYDSAENKYVLGPALIPAQERFKPETTINPSFELAYWHWALQTAQKWKKRLGTKPDDTWQHVLDNLSELPVKDSLYLFTEDAVDSYKNPRYMTDHPIVLGALGFVPETEKVNRKIMANTLSAVVDKWDWPSTWGWDMPLAAMNATLMNKPELAIDLLLKDTPKNTYYMNGHNYQRETLSLYLPGNGALLAAIAMMCTHKNKEGKNGFPDNDKWNVKHEGLFTPGGK